MSAVALPSMEPSIEASARPAVASSVASTVAEDPFPLSTGAELPTPMTVVCSVCQTEVPAEAAFCPLCGTPTRQE